MSESVQEVKERLTEYDRFIIQNATGCADKVVKELIAQSLEEKVDVLFGEMVGTHSISIDEKSDYCLSLALVPKNYKIDLLHFNRNHAAVAAVIFLLDMAKDVYCAIKPHMQLRGLTNNTPFEYMLQLDPNGNLFIDEHSEKRIGVVLKNI
jgi:hypothetical protein